MHPLGPISRAFWGANPLGGHSPLKGVNLDTNLTWSRHVGQVRKKAAQRLGMLGPVLTGGGASPSETEFCSISTHPASDGLRVPYLEVRCSHPCREAVGASIQMSSH